MMKSPLRKHALAILKAALKAADPQEAVLRHVSVRDGVLQVNRKRYKLAKFRNIYVVGAGKASAAMAVAVERLLGKQITEGFINVKYGHLAKVRRIQLNECGHPVPDENGVRGAQEIGRIAAKAGENDLVLFLVSGGASALLPFPAQPITLVEKQTVTGLLLRSGANINEMNAVRKHISSIKGGQLAALANPATVISLILSDVIGDKLDVIGSGPTAPDPSTFADANAILEKYNLTDQIPASIRQRIEDGVRGALPETPKQVERTQNVIVGSNQLALDAAAAEARTLGYSPMVLSSFIEGETREIARMHAAVAREIVAFGRPVKAPACLISGGETTVTIKGEGKGGRNQEFALAAAIDIQDLPGVCILSAGTDGTDGPTDAAGALCDSTTIVRATSAGLNATEFLNRNDSYNFFEPQGDLIKTGPTGTNVMDVRLLLVAGNR
jgi:hydroxypyruvate reductase